jgi:hypothetical protein
MPSGRAAAICKTCIDKRPMELVRAAVGIDNEELQILLFEVVEALRIWQQTKAKTPKPGPYLCPTERALNYERGISRAR